MENKKTTMLEKLQTSHEHKPQQSSAFQMSPHNSSTIDLQQKLKY